MISDNKYICPPGSNYSYLPSPDGKGNSIEVALMKEHRFTFYYWFKWSRCRSGKKYNSSVPALISIDWHQDLCSPCESERYDLDQLNTSSYYDVAKFSWDQLNPLNDGHILAAAYLNLIGDIYVLCKQDPDALNPPLTDKYGNVHHIKCFNNIHELESTLLLSNEQLIYFDIDLDYFTESSDPCGGGDVKVVSNTEILSIINPYSNIMKWCFDRMQGMTIATEPEFCGGLQNSNEIYKQIDLILFAPQLFGKNGNWKHLQV